MVHDPPGHYGTLRIDMTCCIPILPAGMAWHDPSKCYSAWKDHHTAFLPVGMTHHTAILHGMTHLIAILHGKSNITQV